MEQKLRKIVNPLDVVAYTGIPYNLMQADAVQLGGVYSNQMLEDLGRIIGYYKIYDEGVEFLQADGYSEGDYLPADLRYARSAALIDKEARFAFGRPAEFKLALTEEDNEKESAKHDISVLQDLLNEVMRRNKFAEANLKGFKDASIGERVAITVDFNEDGGITVKFLPSYSFMYEQDEFDRLSTLVTFYNINDEEEASKQRIYRKKWYIENGKCWVKIGVYDGSGRPVMDEGYDPEKPIDTKFDYIPGVVILNDGLTGDLDGVSEIKKLGEYEYWYSKLANSDIDAEQQGMNPVRYAIDMSEGSTDRSKLTIKPGAFWDMTSDTELEDGKQGQVGVLETSMSYSEALSKTLDRLSSTMHDTVDVPNISADSMTGVITSGKSLKAIYWPLTVRCDEKMLSWIPALEFVAHTIIEGCRLWPNVAKLYLDSPVPATPYVLTVENPYSLPEDELEEKQSDMAEVTNKVRSRKSYLKKWLNLTDKEADAELQQIAFEEQLFTNSFSKQMYNAAATNTVQVGLQQSQATVESEDETTQQQSQQQSQQAQSRQQTVNTAREALRKQFEGNSASADAAGNTGEGAGK